LIPVLNGKFKQAKRLVNNEIVLAYDHITKKQTEEMIKSILIETVDGYVAPLTMHGTILVNDILTSCYAVVESHTLGHSVMAPVRLWYSINSKLNDIISHFTETRSSILLSANDQVNDGIHWYPQLLYSFSKTFLGSLVLLD
jgi:hypothetical protein